MPHSRHVGARWLSAVVVLVTSALSGCERFETSHSNYARYADAVKADAVGFGKWIPELLPKSARDIRETHNLDSNETWLTFRYSPEDLATTLQHCTKIGEEKTRRARQPLNNWWPTTLSRDTSPAADGKYQYYQCGSKAFLAIEPMTNTAYYWLLGV